MKLKMIAAQEVHTAPGGKPGLTKTTRYVKPPINSDLGVKRSPAEQRGAPAERSLPQPENVPTLKIGKGKTNC